jgi:hypothetical protein
MSRYTHHNYHFGNGEHDDRPKARDYSGLHRTRALTFTFLSILIAIRDKPWS